MSEDENCEGSEPTYDTNDFDVSHSLSIKVEYYRSFEYTLNWTTPMSLRRSSRLKFPQKSPASNEDVTRCRRRSPRGRPRLEETHADESEGSDIIDLITSNPFSKEGAAREAVGLLSYGLDKSNDESGSESSSNSSIVSGPSALCCDYRDQLYRDLCSACHKLYEKTKRLKTPIRSKLLDNDPKSLTCDQWVLMKRWKPKGQPDARRRLLSHIQLDDGVIVRRGEQSSPCSRPHIFLKRNLRRANSKAENQKKKRRRKRTSSSQGSRVAKQQRLQNNSLHQHTKTKAMVDNSNRSFNSVSDPRDQVNPETEGCAKDGVTEVVPASADVRAPRRAPKKMGEFRDLLVQLRGSSSVIIRETS